MSTPPPRRCPCGNDRAHPDVVAEPRYSAMGWLLLCVGITAEPVRIEYTCKRCRSVLATETDPEVLRKHT